VQRHAGVDQEGVFIGDTVFDALWNAGGELRFLAEAEAEGLGGARTDEEFGSLRQRYVNSNTWHGLAENAARTYEQAAKPAQQRAPQYGTSDAEANLRNLRAKAMGCVEAIFAEGPPGFRIWECSDLYSDCSLGKGEE
jgi:hypothetical protein